MEKNPWENLNAAKLDLNKIDFHQPIIEPPLRVETPPAKPKGGE